MSTTWNSNGAATGGSGAYVTGTQSVKYIHDNFAVDGDTITIPDGNYTWSAQIDLTKAIAVRAQNMTADARVTPSNVNITHGGATRCILTFTIGTTGHSELGGINFLPGSTSGGTQSYLEIIQSGATPPAKVMLLHDCTFNIPNFQLLNAVNWLANGGVINRNRFFGSTGGNQGSGSGCLTIKQGIVWSNLDTFGTADTTGNANVYVEDNIFDNLYNQAIDGDDNCRLVIRNNKLNNSQVLTHGVTSLQGGRLFEFYGNVCDYFPVNFALQRCTASGQTPDNGGQWPNMIRWIWLRSGTARIHDNTFTQIMSYGYYNTAPMLMVTDEPLTRSGPSQGFQNDWDYPGWHWCGTGGSHSGDTTLPPSYATYQIVDPIYCWNNTYTGAGAQPVANQWGIIDYSGYGQDAAAPLTRSGTTSNGLKTITGLSQTSDLHVNQPVMHANFPSGTVIVTKDSSSQVTVNNNATASGTVSLSFGINATPDVLLLNRDLYINTAPPSGAGGVAGPYVAYTYPHPLAAGATSGTGGGGGSSGSGGGTGGGGGGGGSSPGGASSANNNPFLPVVFPTSPSTTKVATEDGPGFYVDRTGTKITYNGQTQTKTINAASPRPPTNTLPGAALGMSAIP